MQKLSRGVVNQPGIAKISLHPLRGIGRFSIQPGAFSRRQLVLEFPAEAIVITSVLIMQKASNAEKKISGGIQVSVCGRLRCFKVGKPRVLIKISKHRQPTSDVVVPEAAGRIFHIWLKVKDSVSEFCMPRLSDFR